SMIQSRIRGVDASHSRLANFETDVEVRVRDRCVNRVEPAHAHEIVTPDRETSGGQGGHIAHRLGGVSVINRISRPLLARRADQTAHTRDQTRVLNLSSCVKQFWRNRAHLRIFERLDQVLNPIALGALYIVVEENKARPGRGLRAEITFVRKIERLVITDETESRSLRRGTFQQI